MSKDRPLPSKLLLDECFAAEDDRFLTELGRFSSHSYLVHFLDRWLSDPRPWARAIMRRYLLSDWDKPGHEVVIKRLFKHFEQIGDLEMLAVFFTGLDRVVRRSRLYSYRYDSKTKRTFAEERLFARPNRTVIDQTDRFRMVKFLGKERKYPLPDLRNRPQNRSFSHATRNYLRRRVWRYFRRLSFQEPDKYVQYVTVALMQYEDRDFAAGENLLDCWSLVHACFFSSPSLTFTASHCNLAVGGTLSSLNAAPYQPEAWKTTAAAESLTALVVAANSRLARLWAIELLESFHRSFLEQIELTALVPLLAHADPEVAAFAGKLFEQHGRLPTLNISVWLEILRQANPQTLDLICDSMRRHVSSSRFSTEQLLELSRSRPAQIARLGFDWVVSHHERQPLRSEQLVELASVQCSVFAQRIGGWALEQLSKPEHYRTEDVVEFFDASLSETRAAALTWLESPDSPGQRDLSLWAKIAESPFADVRLGLVELMRKNIAMEEKISRLPGEHRTRLWASVILGVHQGSRTKLHAIDQVANALIAAPDQVESLLPILAVACRSVRSPEKRHALAALVRLMTARPELQIAVKKVIPELQINPLELASP